MSWQPYIDQLKTPDSSGTIPIEEAAICGFNSGQESVWVSSPGLSNITVEEIKKMSGDVTPCFQSGIYIGGVKCRLLRDLKEDGFDAKTAPDAGGNSYNICVGRSNKALVIGKGNKDASGGQVRNKLYNTVKHLKDANY